MANLKPREPIRPSPKNLLAFAKFYLRLLTRDGLAGVKLSVKAAMFVSGVAGLLWLALIVLGLSDNPLFRALASDAPEKWFVSALRVAFVVVGLAMLMWRYFERYAYVLRQARTAIEQRDKARAQVSRLADGLLANEPPVATDKAEIQRASGDDVAAALARVDAIGLTYDRLSSRDLFLSAYQHLTQPYFSMPLVAKQLGAGYYQTSWARSFVERMWKQGLVEIIHPAPYTPSEEECRGYGLADRYVMRWLPAGHTAGRELDAQEKAFYAATLAALRTTEVVLAGQIMSARDAAVLLWPCTNFLWPEHLGEMRERLALPELTEGEVRAVLKPLEAAKVIETEQYPEYLVVRSHYLYGRDLYFRAKDERDAEVVRARRQSASHTARTAP